MSLRSWFGLRISQISIQPSVDSGLCPSMGQGYTGSKRPTNSGDVCRTTACSDLKPYNSVNILHKKRKKNTISYLYLSCDAACI